MWYGNDSGSTLHYFSINSKAYANNNKKFKEIESNSTSTTYKIVNFVRLENVPFSSFWILLPSRYLLNKRTKKMGGQNAKNSYYNNITLKEIIAPNAL